MTQAKIDREERYTVIKHKDLTVDDRAELDQLIHSRHIPTRECLVIEGDWPEYEPAWRMIEARVTGAAQQPQATDWKASGADWCSSIHRNPDAEAWADFFVATFPGLADKHDLMLGWFANAMMAMHDYLKAQQPQSEYGDAYQGAREDLAIWKRRALDAEAARADELKAERDTLRQQLAERDAIIERLRVKLMTIASAEPGRHNIEWAKAMAATGNNEAYAKWREAFDQRDKLADILRDLVPGCKWRFMRPRIDAALAEVKPCPESPAPTT